MVGEIKLIRSVTKAILWRIVSAVVTTSVAYAISGELTLSIAIGSIDGIIKTVLYILHERIWNKIKWGKN